MESKKEKKRRETDADNRMLENIHNLRAKKGAYYTRTCGRSIINSLSKSISYLIMLVLRRDFKYSNIMKLRQSNKLLKEVLKAETDDK